jgi:hypothetical protein
MPLNVPLQGIFYFHFLVFLVFLVAGNKYYIKISPYGCSNPYDCILALLLRPTSNKNILYFLNNLLKLLYYKHLTVLLGYDSV